MADDIGITIRTRGGRRAAQDVRRVSTEIGGLRRAAVTAGTGMRSLGQDTTRLGGRGLGMLRNQAATAGLAIGGIGTLAVRSGLQFNASMEQNEIAFTQFLGSAGAARREMDTLFNIARRSPFELAGVTTAARQLLAYGFPLKQANSLLVTLGDAAAGAGVGAEGISRMVLALGQIRGKGTLQMEELRQLQEMGVLDMDKLAKNLGITQKELGDVGKQGIPASKAIGAIKKSLDDTFGGQSQRQARSFSGQLSTLRDDFNQTMGVVTRPLFNDLRRNVFPALDGLVVKLRDIWSGDSTGEMKLFASRREIRSRLAPLVDGAGDAIGDMHLGRLLAEQVEAGTPFLLNAAANAGPKMARALISGWWHSGKWAKLATAAFIGLKLASFVARGALMGRGFRTGWGAGVGTLPAPIAPTPGVPGKGKGGGGWLRRGLKWGGAASIPLLPIGAAAWLTDKFGKRPVTEHNPLDPGPSKGPRLPPGQSWFERKHGGAPRTRAAAHREGDIVVHTHFEADGQKLAHVVHRHARNANANRRGG